MKNYISRLALLLGLAMAFPMFVNSCKEVDPDNNEQDKEVIEQGMKPDTIQFANDFPVPHPKLAFDVYNGLVKATADGVSVEVTHKDPRNVKFICRPGENVASYKLDVYPLAIFYNSLLEKGALGADKKTVDQAIRETLFNATGSGGYSFDADRLGEDYKEYEFDWANTEYAQVKFVPGAQYIIAVAGCYDKSGSLASAMDLNLIYVETPSQSLIGSPSVELKVITGYRAFNVIHTPNSDCKGVYYYATNTDQVDEFVDTFGERLYRDFMRHSSVPNDPVSADDEQNLYYNVKFSNPDPKLSVTATAIAVDENGTPAEHIIRKDFHLKEIPADAMEATMTYNVKPGTIAASYAELDVQLDNNCYAGFHYTMPKEMAEQYMNASDEVKKAYAQTLANEGYGIKNDSFSFNVEENKPDGFEHTTMWQEFTLKPDTEYVIVYCGKNYYGEVSRLQFSEPFKTKPRILDNPEACESDLTLVLSDPTRESFKFNFTYTPEKVSNYYFVCIDPIPYDPEHGYAFNAPAVGASHQEWMEFFFGEGSEVNETGTGHGIYINLWTKEPSGYDTYTLSGFNQGQKVTYAYVSEDMNGVVSKVQFAEITTKVPQVGPNPKMEIVPTFDKETKTWSVSFNVVQDVEKFRYTLNDEDEMKLAYLGGDYYRAFEFYNHWDNFVVELGLWSYGESSYATCESGKICVALCAGWGRDENGNEVISKLEYVILTPEGEMKKIKDYYPNYVEK